MTTKFADDGPLLTPIRRFPTPVERVEGTLTWSFDTIMRETILGLEQAAETTALASIGIDAWGLDYGLLDATGRVLMPLHAYRSDRTLGVPEAAVAAIGRERMYGITGVPVSRFSTICQLVAEKHTTRYADAARLLMLPDLVANRLCGSTVNGLTSASTTGLLDVRTREWSDELVAAADLRRDLLPELRKPGVPLGGMLETASPALAGVPVTGVASHDTACAAAAAPLAPDDGLISLGTWACMGREAHAPLTSPAALALGISNELGFQDTVMVLRNGVGMWLLEECRRAWKADGLDTDFDRLAAAARSEPPGRAVVDPDAFADVSPLPMPARIVERCRATGQFVPCSPGQITRVVLDSLALSFRRGLAAVAEATGTPLQRVHLIGGGSRNDLLAELTASACGLPVLCGEPEATAVGNALVQAIVAGQFADLAEARAMMARTRPPRRVDPTPTADWPELEMRIARDAHAASA